MISPQRIRALDLVAAESPGRSAHLSAASGLVRAGKFLYVVADDELHLGVFDAAGAAAGSLLRLFDGELPESGSKRKKKKPDLEALTLLPPFAAFAHGALFALGSGSRIAVHRVDLGEIDGIALCFTDGAALPGGAMVFTAVAEDTDDGFFDGPCAGAALGMLGPDGNLRFLDRLDRPHKIEGVDAQVDGNAIRLLLVTDADDASVPAALYSASIPMYGDAQ